MAVRFAALKKVSILEPARARVCMRACVRVRGGWTESEGIKEEEQV